MNISIDRSVSQLFPLFFVGLIGILIIAYLLYVFLKKKDNSKPIHRENVKVIEKPIQQGNVEWYIMESEDGRRLKLRSFQGNTTIITVGDVGVVEYRGKTVQSFERQS